MTASDKTAPTLRASPHKHRGTEMQIVAFESRGGQSLGVVKGETFVDLEDLDKSLARDLKLILERKQLGLVADLADKAPAKVFRPLADLRYALPLPTMGKMFASGLNYKDHVAEGPFERQPYPTFFMRAATSLIPHNQEVLRPNCSETLDWEGELVVVIGERCKQVSVADALSVVAGYICHNDISVRDFQRHTLQWTVGKNFDRTGALGPFFVTADALPPGAIGLKIETRLNGQVVQSSNTANMIFSVAETIAYLSQGITLEPGDLIAMGTPSGVGHARTPPLWMKPGDVVEVEIEGLGVLRNDIGQEPPRRL